MKDAVDFLMAQRAPGAVLIDRFPAGVAPRDAVETRAIQLALLERLGPIGGWKVGASSPSGEPVASPLPAAGILPSPAALPSRLGGVEAEICFGFAHALPPRALPYTGDDVAAAIGTCHAAIEMLDPRFANHAALDPLSNLADLGMHGGLVVGQPIAAWDFAMFEGLRVTVTIDGAVLRDMRGGAAGGAYLLRLLTALANMPVVRDAGGLKAGALVTTGSWTGVEIVPPGSVAVAHFDGFAPVEVRRALL